MNLTEWAKAQGVHPQAAYRWFREGALLVPAVWVGPRMVLVNLRGQDDGAGGIGLYARVSSRDQKDDLDRLMAWLGRWAADVGAWVVRCEAEVGSGMNGSRVKVRGLLADSDVAVVVVERRDRLGWMNTELVGAVLSASGRRLVVLDSGEVEGDLVRDMIEVMTSFCSRLYGRRCARNRALKALRCDEYWGVGAVSRKKKLRVIAEAGLTEPRWRARWDAARLFATADGESGKRFGNETIRLRPGGWLTIKIPEVLVAESASART